MSERAKTELLDMYPPSEEAAIEQIAALKFERWTRGRVLWHETHGNMRDFYRLGAKRILHAAPGSYDRDFGSAGIKRKVLAVCAAYDNRAALAGLPPKADR